MVMVMERTCVFQRYDTADDAERSLRRLNAEQRLIMGARQCEDCDGYHLRRSD